MMIQKSDILDTLTCEMFGLDPESQAPKIAEYVKQVLASRGYEGIHNHGWSLVKFRKDCYEYGVWIEDKENVVCGILKYIGKPMEYRHWRFPHRFFDRYRENYTMDNIESFLEKVDRHEWKVLEDISIQLSSMEEKYGDDFLHIIKEQAY